MHRLFGATAHCFSNKISRLVFHKIGLGVVWIITLIAWWRQRKPSSVSTSPIDSTQLQNLRMARKVLKQACEQNNPQSVKQALLDWATIRWDKIPIHNLGHTIIGG